MDVAHYLSGGAAYRMKLQVAQTVSNVGVPLLASTEAEAGLDLPTTTNAADMVGLNFDTATYVTAQQTDGTSAERVVLVDVRPDCVIEALLSGAGAENTALTTYDVTTATTDGLDVTTGDNWGSPEFDDGAVWGYTGANAGQIRKITATSATAATVTVAFDNDHQVGDLFLRAPFWPFDDQSGSVTLSTNFYQVDASAATTTSGAELLPIKINAKTQAGEGTTKSTVLLVSNDHFLNKLS